MLALKLALRNLLGAGLRTWLNVIVLSFSFIIIIWTKGLLEGWDRQAKNDMIEWEVGQGQYWHRNYDPYDPFTLNDSHGALPESYSNSAEQNLLVPVLITQGTIYPQGRMQSVLIKGIPPEQQVLKLPTGLLDPGNGEIPAIIGKSMAESTGLGEGDYVTVRWRDRNGTFDATEVRIAGIFETTVPSIDGGQLWIPLENLQAMMLMPGEATLIVRGIDAVALPSDGEWVMKEQRSYWQILTILSRRRE